MKQQTSSTSYKDAVAKVLEFITNSFYSDPGSRHITVGLNNEPGKNFYDKHQIQLSTIIMEEFKKLGLPQFTVFYHELAHHIFSTGLFVFEEKWAQLQSGPLEYKSKYHHLMNWIEDYYIEDQMVKKFPYTTDVLGCIKKTPPAYDISKIEYAFNYFYVHDAVTPALSYIEGTQFLAYINKLLALRQDGTTRFGRGVVTHLYIKKKSKEIEFAETIIDFYNWCVQVGIFQPDQTLPDLENPNNHLETQGDGTNSTGKQGSYSDHSGQVGRTYKEVAHIKNATTMFNDTIVNETKMINRELLDMQRRQETEHTTLDGLFTARHIDSTLIQPKVNIPNFFNPNRLIDRNLFKEKQHTYMNVAIYRDISVSTEGGTHALMEKVTAHLHKEIPVDITYYLYASGEISIVEVPYIPWENSSDRPYKGNPLVEQMDGGTNSSAIADVITQQLSDKWLNIVITDGDLGNLMHRDNIEGLLHNVFAICVHGNKPDNVKGMRVLEEKDIEGINGVLSTINMV